MGSQAKRISDHLILVTVLVLCLVICHAHDSFTSSRATYYGCPECHGNPRGACGYGEYGATANDGYVTGVSRLYKNGAGCGACYQVRCKDARCSDDGATVVVTDSGAGDGTDFVLDPKAYAKLAQPGKVKELFACGVIRVEFRRVPCQFSSNDTVFVKIHENSKYPHYLALVILYIPGENEITAVELWQADLQEWRPMRRAFGAVFDMENPPRGPINARFQVRGINGVTWVQPKKPFASDWEAGTVYDTELRLDD